MLKEVAKSLSYRTFGRYINIPLLSHLFLRPIRPNLKNLDDIYQQFKVESEKTRSLDLGCGFSPSNGFNADEAYGLDLYDDPEKNILKCRLGHQRIPFEKDSIDYLVASNILEHIPRVSSNTDCDHYPFIFLMNECYRVLKPGGRFISITPMYPYPAAFQDPTHVNFITASTFDLYFSNNRLPISAHYGIASDFGIIFRATLGQALVMIMTKK